MDRAWKFLHSTINTKPIVDDFGEDNNEELNETLDLEELNQFEQPIESSQPTKQNFDKIEKQAQGSLAKTTLKSYQGQIKIFRCWFELYYPEYFIELEKPTDILPKIIGTWIYVSCGSDNKFFEDDDRFSKTNSTYSHALIMRASITWWFDITKNRGRQPFAQNSNEEWHGNPSLSTFVSQIMKTLAREKVRIL